MKRLLLICIGLWICSLSFAQYQSKSDTTYCTATITILPPPEANFGDIYCYCIEYFLAENFKNKATWRYFYALPAVTPKGKYVETTCVLTRLMAGKSYAFRIYAYYWGYDGEYGATYWIGDIMPKDGGNFSYTYQCMPTKIKPWNTTP